MTDQPDLNATWKRVQELIQEGDINRSLWDAAAAAVPLEVDGDTLVLGFVPGQMQEGSQLTSGANRPQVVAALEEAFGRRITMEIIEGTDPDAWQREKERREITAEQAQASYDSRQMKGSRVVWSELYEAIGKAFGTARERRFALSRARTFVKALKLMLEAEEKARAEEPDNEEMHVQQLNRSIDRIATYAEIPGTLVALEYLRLKAAKK